MFEGKRLQILKNISSLTIVQLINYIVPLILIPYVISTLGIENFGRISLALAFCSYFASFVKYSFELTAVKSISESDSDWEKISRIFSVVMTTKIVLALFCLFLLSLLLVSGVYSEISKLVSLAFAFCVIAALNQNFFFQGIQKMHFLLIFQAISKVVLLVGTFVFVKVESDSAVYLICMIASSVVLVALSIYVALKKFDLKISKVYWSEVKEQLFLGRQIYLSNLSVNLYSSNFNINILGAIATPYVVGVFSLGFKVFLLVGTIGTPIVNAIYPNFAALRNSNVENFRSSLIKVSKILFTFFLAVSIFSYFLSPYLFNVLADGPELDDSIFLFGLLCFSIPLIPFGPLVTQYLILEGKENSLLIFSFILCAVNLASFYFLANNYSFIGIALNNFLIYLIVLSFFLFLVNTKENQNLK